MSLFTGKHVDDFETWSEFYDSDPDIDRLTEAYDFEGKTVLEPGAGSGRLAFRLAPQTEQYIATDIDDRLMTYCQDQDDVPEQLSFLTQDSLGMALEKDSVDAIIDSWAFSSYPSPQQGAAEYERVLKDDGDVLVLREVGESEYETVLQEFIPADREYDIEDEVDATLADRFGEPMAERDIESGYVFDSVDDAVEAFRFHLEEWSNMEMSAEQHEELYALMDEREREDGTVYIGEKARFLHFSV